MMTPTSDHYENQSMGVRLKLKITFHSILSTASLNSLPGGFQPLNFAGSNCLKKLIFRVPIHWKLQFSEIPHLKFAICLANNNAFGTRKHIWELFRRQFQFRHWGKVTSELGGGKGVKSWSPNQEAAGSDPLPSPEHGGTHGSRRE